MFLVVKIFYALILLLNVYSHSIISKGVCRLQDRQKLKAHITRAREGWGKCYISSSIISSTSPPKKSPSKKYSDLYFCEPHPPPPRSGRNWLKPMGRTSFCPPKTAKSGLDLILEYLSKHGRTHFSKNSWFRLTTLASFHYMNASWIRVHIVEEDNIFNLSHFLFSQFFDYHTLTGESTERYVY